MSVSPWVIKLAVFLGTLTGLIFRALGIRPRRTTSSQFQSGPSNGFNGFSQSNYQSNFRNFDSRGSFNSSNGSPFGSSFNSSNFSSSRTSNYNDQDATFSTRGSSLHARAEAGDLRAQDEICRKCYFGKDYVNANFWAKKLIERKHPVGFYISGLILLHGKLGITNRDVARQGFQIGALLGHEPSKRILKEEFGEEVN